MIMITFTAFYDLSLYIMMFEMIKVFIILVLIVKNVIYLYDRHDKVCIH